MSGSAVPTDEDFIWFLLSFHIQYETEKGNVERAELLKQQRHIDKRIQAMNVDCDRLTRQLDEANTRNAQLEEKIKQLEKDGVEQLGKYHVSAGINKTTL